jgi:2'-5' RNA ligase
MSEYSDSVAIMFPANYPDDRQDPHCTLIWLGTFDTVSASQQEILAVLAADDYTPSTEYKALPPKIFGKDDERVVVLPLDDADGSLKALRTKLDTALAAIGVKSVSEYTDYVPHVTTEDYVPGQTKMSNYPVPASIKLGPAELWWGDERVA